jgi:hypothetical protein
MGPQALLQMDQSIARSDDFRWFGPEENLDEWDSAV